MMNSLNPVRFSAATSTIKPQFGNQGIESFIKNLKAQLSPSNVSVTNTQEQNGFVLGGQFSAQGQSFTVTFSPGAVGGGMPETYVLTSDDGNTEVRYTGVGCFSKTGPTVSVRTASFSDTSNDPALVQNTVDVLRELKAQFQPASASSASDSITDILGKIGDLFKKD